MLPLRGIINICVALRIHPNTLTLIGVLINVGAAWALAFGRFILAFVLMLVANIFDFIDGKVAHQLQLQSEFGAFWDSTLDRFSDLALLTGLIFLYSKLGRSDYVLIAALTLIFSIMTSYARARAESLVERCKVGFMERPERIVLFMIGAATNRMAGVLWVVFALVAFLPAVSAEAAPAKRGGAPPKVLNLVRQTLKRGAATAYVGLESTIAAAYHRAKIPLYWVCLQSAKNATEVLYLNVHESREQADSMAAVNNVTVPRHPELHQQPQ